MRQSVSSARSGRENGSVGAAHGRRVLPPDVQSRPSRRRVSYLVTGALLIVVCALAGVLLVSQLGHRQQVLAVAKPVAAGQVLASSDLTIVGVAADGRLDVLLDSEAAGVVGRVAAVPLSPGQLLARSSVGASPSPPSGRGVVAIAAKPGQAPPSVAAGARVAVLQASGERAGPATPARGGGWEGIVLDVRADTSVTIVSVEMADGDARAVAALPPGAVSVVLLAPGG